MKVGPKEQRQRLLGPSGIERQYGGEPKADYTIRKAVTKLAVTKIKDPAIQKFVTEVTKQFVTPKSVTGKRGVKPKGEKALTPAERMKAYRARKAKTTS